MTSSNAYAERALGRWVRTYHEHERLLPRVSKVRNAFRICQELRNYDWQVNQRRVDVFIQTMYDLQDRYPGSVAVEALYIDMLEFAGYAGINLNP